jgi:hypothetical protein
MPITRIGYDRIRKMHESGNHERCKFGCCPDNPAPNQDSEFSKDYTRASLELAGRLGRNDPRVAVAFDAREFLNSQPDLPPMILGEIACVAALIEDLSGDEPNALEMIQVRSARRLLDEINAGVYHKTDDVI